MARSRDNLRPVQSQITSIWLAYATALRAVMPCIDIQKSAATGAGTSQAFSADNYVLAHGIHGY